MVSVNSPVFQAASSPDISDYSDVYESTSDDRSTLGSAASSPDILEYSDEYESVSDDRSTLSSAASSPDVSEYSNGCDSVFNDRPTLTPDLLLDILSYLSSPDSDFGDNDSEDNTSGTDGASDADDERSSCDGDLSGINGSPRFPHEGKIVFEGNIWNEIAEADDGINEVNEGFSALLERERIRLEEEHRRRDWLVSAEPNQDRETHDNSNAAGGLGSASVHGMEGVEGTLVEEPPPCEYEDMDSLVGYPDLGSPMSLDFTGTRTPLSPMDTSYLGTPANPFCNRQASSAQPGISYPDPTQSPAPMAEFSARDTLHTRTHPELVLRHSPPDCRHHPYKRTRNT
ncbi:hypothetical protein FRC08_007127 [Ceratobasidium sp. 394]|nr:hypothetical protein FRC08_007127 [Ceratobasidium sp. 394]